MLVGAQRQQVTPDLRDYIMQHNQRITQLSGQTFGPAHINSLLQLEAYFDSAPPSAAILAAEQLNASGLSMLSALQQAYYREGQRITDAAILHACAQQIGLDAAAFSSAMASQTDAVLDAHFKQSRRKMAELGMRGFPALALQTGTQWQIIDLGPFFGKPQAFQAWLQQAASAPTSPVTAAQCSLDGCSA